MKYMLLIYSEEQGWSEEEREACMRESMGICEELAAQGRFIAADPLHPVATATSVRIREGKRLLTDGPFAETREQLGGYYLIDVDNLDEAIAIASRLPPAKKGTVEIRPVFDTSSLESASDCEIVSWRVLPFSPEEVFGAFADPTRLTRWWGPAGFRNTFHEFDFRPGGHWRFVMHGPNGIDYDNHSVFVSVVAPSSIILDHESNPKFRMTMTFTESSPAHTRLEWRMRFATRELRDKIAAYACDGNEQNYDRLTEELRTGSGSSSRTH